MYCARICRTNINNHRSDIYFVLSFSGMQGKQHELSPAFGTTLSDTWMLTFTGRTHPPSTDSGGGSNGRNGGYVGSGYGGEYGVGKGRAPCTWWPCKDLRWIRLSTLPPASRTTSMASIGNRAAVLLFGGFVAAPFADHAIVQVNASDTWTIGAGCPPGMFLGELGCHYCPKGMYSEASNNQTKCTACPPLLSTISTGARNVFDCGICARYNSSDGQCGVYGQKPVWQCSPVAWGDRCQNSCQGTEATASLMPSSGSTPPPPSNSLPPVGPAPCSGNGKCRNGPHGDGTCVCTPMYIGSVGCRFPFLAVAVAGGAALVIILLLLLVRWRKSMFRKKRELFHTQGLLQAEHEQLEVEQYNVATHKETITSLQEGWRVDEVDLSLSDRIASGGFGEVWLGRWALLPGCDVAVKKLFITPSSLDTLDTSKGVFGDKEIKLMMRTRHKRVVLFLGAGQLSNGSTFLVSEYMAGGDLRRLLACGDPLPWSRRVRVALDVAEGMVFLHGRMLIHRDLKSPNVLIDLAGRAKIADFGLARFTRDEALRGTLTGGKASAVLRDLMRDRERTGSTSSAKSTNSMDSRAYSGGGEERKKSKESKKSNGKQAKAAKKALEAIGVWGTPSKGNGKWKGGGAGVHDGYTELKDAADDLPPGGVRGRLQRGRGSTEQDELCHLMRDELEVRDRFYHMKRYRRCFLGTDAVRWIANAIATANANATANGTATATAAAAAAATTARISGESPAVAPPREPLREGAVAEALVVGNQMLAVGLFRHVVDGHQLENKKLFYRFAADEGRVNDDESDDDDADTKDGGGNGVAEDVNAEMGSNPNSYPKGKGWNDAGSPSKPMTTGQGTISWMAPEVRVACCVRLACKAYIFCST